jgi:hypothetical protein
MSNVEIIVKIYSVKLLENDYNVLLAINCYEIIGNFRCLQMSPCQLVTCSTNIYCVIIELDPVL